MRIFFVLLSFFSLFWNFPVLASTSTLVRLPNGILIGAVRPIEPASSASTTTSKVIENKQTPDPLEGARYNGRDSDTIMLKDGRQIHATPEIRERLFKLGITPSSAAKQKAAAEVKAEREWQRNLVSPSFEGRKPDDFEGANKTKEHLENERKRLARNAAARRTSAEFLRQSRLDDYNWGWGYSREFHTHIPGKIDRNGRTHCLLCGQFM